MASNREVDLEGLAERDCFNALHGRTIKSIGFSNSCRDLTIKTHDGLTFKVYSGLPMGIEQVNEDKPIHIHTYPGEVRTIKI